MNPDRPPGTGRRRIVIVDDHAAFADLVRIALNGLDDLECVGTAYTAAEGVVLVHRTAPDIAVIDLGLGADDGIQLLRRLRAERADLVLVVASAQADTSTMTAVAVAGGNGFAPKSGAFDELLAVLRSARTGAMSVAPSLVPDGLADPQQAWLGRLTTRETEVLTLMAGGATVPDMARMLHISLNTCRSHVRSVHVKLGVSTQLEAVLKAQQLGLVRSADT